MATKPTAAIDRIRAANGDAYDATNNPGGLAQGGHRQNFVPDLNAVVDIGLYVEALSDETADNVAEIEEAIPEIREARTEVANNRTAAANSASAAAASAAGVNLPPITTADAGKFLAAKSDGTGFETKTIADAPQIKPITMTAPTAGATNLGSGGTYTFVVRAFVGDTTGFYSDYGIPLATRFVRAYEPGGTTPVVVFTVAGSGVSFPVNFTGSGLAVSHTYEFQAGYTDAQGNTVLSQRVSATTAAQFKPSIGQAYEGGFLAYERFGDGNLFDLVTAAKSTEASKIYGNGTSTLAYSRLNGPSNSTLVVNAAGAPALNTASGYANSISIGGVAAYLAAIDEARAISFKLRPANAPVAAFQAGGAEAFIADGHWSSTELTAGNASGTTMTTGSDVSTTKAQTLLVRPIKRIQLTPPYAIGTAMEGGYLAAYFTDLSSGTPVTYMLIVADKATEVSRDMNSAGSSAGTISRTNGVSNTNGYWNYGPQSPGNAAKYCYDLVTGGKDDWYLGAIDEMLAISRMNASLPSAQQLPTTGFAYSSTEFSANIALTVNLANATQGDTNSVGAKADARLVRPIRRVALT